jgi:hypothetical protein
MKLRNGKTVKEPPKQSTNEFIRIYYEMKNQYEYTHFYNQPSYDTKYTLCTLYTAFKLFINKEYKDEKAFVNALSSKKLLPTRTLISNADCYICGEHDSKPTIYCIHGHDVHLECYFEKILTHIQPIYCTFSVPNDPQRCDYCGDHMVISYS